MVKRWFKANEATNSREMKLKEVMALLLFSISFILVCTFGCIRCVSGILKMLTHLKRRINGWTYNSKRNWTQIYPMNKHGTNEQKNHDHNHRRRRRRYTCSEWFIFKFYIISYYFYPFLYTHKTFAFNTYEYEWRSEDTNTFCMAWKDRQQRHTHEC